MWQQLLEVENPKAGKSRLPSRMMPTTDMDEMGPGSQKYVYVSSAVHKREHEQLETVEIRNKDV